MTRHMLGLMHGRPGARAFRRILTVESIGPGAGLEVVDRTGLAPSLARGFKLGGSEALNYLVTARWPG